MSETNGTSKSDIKVVIEDNMLVCCIPLTNPDGDESKSKIVAYGALKLAEEQVSIYFMQKAVRRAQLLRPPLGSFRPGLA